jgi:hypothetical protein
VITAEHAAILFLEADGRFEETTSPIRRYDTFIELLLLPSGRSSALWSRRLRSSSLASLESYRELFLVFRSTGVLGNVLEVIQEYFRTDS